MEEQKVEGTIKTLISEKEIAEKVRELGEQINRDYAGTSIHMICVLKGGVFFLCDLAKEIKVPVTVDFMSVKSYGNGTSSSGNVRIEKDLEESIAGKDVLIVEDIIDSGQTLGCLTNMLRQRQPASLKLCTFLDKPSRRKADIKVDYMGYEIPDCFAIGYGLDYAGRYRNLPYVGILEEMDQKGV